MCTHNNFVSTPTDTSISTNKHRSFKPAEGAVDQDLLLLLGRLPGTSGRRGVMNKEEP